jgi:hypothetical protein
MRYNGRILALAAALVVVFAVAAPAAFAAKPKHGITLLGPKEGAVVPTVIASSRVPTFKARVRGPGSVWIRVCKRKQLDRAGELCSNDPDEIDRPKRGKKTRRGRFYSFKPEAYTFDSYYLNSPGRYWWQIYRIDCVDTRGPLDCTQESRLRKFTVR